VLINLTSSQARSWFLLPSNTDSSEPPSTDGASPPSLPGSGNAPILSFRSGAASTIAFGVQLPAMIMPAWPLEKASFRSVSRHVEAAGVEKPFFRARSA
jgi:hypothetical protein